MFAGELNTIFFLLTFAASVSKEAHYCYPFYAGPEKTALVLRAIRLQVMKYRPEKHDCGRLAASIRACEPQYWDCSEDEKCKVYFGIEEVSFFPPALEPVLCSEFKGAGDKANTRP